MKHLVLLALLAVAAFAGPAKPHYPMMSATPAGATVGPQSSVATGPRILEIRARQEQVLERGDRAELKRLEAEAQAILLEHQPQARKPDIVLGRVSPAARPPQFDGPDARIDTGTFVATGADYSMDGTMYAVGFRSSDTVAWLYRSTDHGTTWEDLFGYYFIRNHRLTATKLSLVVGEGDSAFVYLILCFDTEPDRVLYLMRADLDGLNGELLYVHPGPDTTTDFAACRDYTGDNYWLYAVAVNDEDNRHRNARYLRSTDYGRTWAITDSGSYGLHPHHSFGAGSWLHHALEGSEPTNTGEVWLFHNPVFGAHGMWVSQLVHVDTFSVRDPVIAPAFTLPESSAAVWTLFSHDYMGTGDWDMLYAWSTNGGRDWVDWNYLSGDYDSLERFADLRNYASPGNIYVNGSYIWESDALRKVFRHYSNGAVPGDWSDTTRINTNSAGTGRATRPLLVYSPGSPGTGSGCVFVGAGLRNLYFNSPWLTALHETGRGPFARTRPTVFSSGLLNLPAALTALHSAFDLFDATGRRVLNLTSGLNDLGRLPSGVYQVRAEDGAVPLRVVLMR